MQRFQRSWTRCTVSVRQDCGWRWALVSACGAAWAQANVTYGRVTRVNMVTQTNPDAQVAGAMVGGIIGLASGSGRSRSNRALRAAGGGLAGQQIARMGSNRQTFEYTILIDGTSTFTMITDEGGHRVGDCVAVERGGFNNLRLVDDARCAPRRAQAKRRHRRLRRRLRRRRSARRTRASPPRTGCSMPTTTPTSSARIAGCACFARTRSGSGDRPSTSRSNAAGAAPGSLPGGGPDSRP